MPMAAGKGPVLIRLTVKSEKCQVSQGWTSSFMLELLQAFDLWLLRLIPPIIHFSLERHNIRHFAKTYLTKKLSFQKTSDIMVPEEIHWGSPYLKSSNAKMYTEYVNWKQAASFPNIKLSTKVSNLGLPAAQLLSGSLPSPVNARAETNFNIRQKIEIPL